MDKYPLTRRDAALGITSALLSYGSALAASARRGRDVRRFGAVGDGRTDDTAALTRAHASGEPLIYPKTSAYYRITEPLEVRADVFGKGGEIRIQGDGNNRRELLRIGASAPPVTITGLILDGEYDAGSSGEWSHTIACRSARNVRIINNIIRRPYGDCIYIGVDNTKTPCRDIVIEHNRLEHPRRCVTAVISADRVRIAHNQVLSRHDYVSAIDLEPNPNGADRVHDVEVVGNSFDVVGEFMRVTAGLHEHTTGIVAAQNTGRARTFLWVSSSAQMNGGEVRGNEFTATAPAKGCFLRADSANGLILEGNRDLTPCRLGYVSIRPNSARGLVLRQNRFCG